MDNNKKLRVGITHGDVNGIGYEVIIKALGNPAMLELCTPVIYGSSKALNYHRRSAEMPNFQLNNVRKHDSFRENLVNLVETCPEEIKIDYGTPDKQVGRAAFMALEAAVADLKQGRIDVLVTAPINKETIQSENFHFPGHTEYLEASLGDGEKALMLMCAPELRVAVVTTHVPMAKLSQAITQEAVVEKLRIFDRSLRRDFGIDAPRIAVLSLNPHAGENGVIGHEEQDVIIPAMNTAYDQLKISCFGPYAADGFFGTDQYRHFDGVLAMYHDQGMIPFKMLARDEGVNFTAGLPVVRTSPAHGTGYDIAGKGLADETSMRHAIFTAIDIARNRERWDEAHANPLRRLYHDHSKDNVVLDLTKDEEE